MVKKQRTPTEPPSRAQVPVDEAVPLRWWWSAVALLIGVAVLVRVLAARDDLWFDEVWSLYKFALADGTAWDNLAQNHDNNHHLVSLWMYLLGLRHQWFHYRIPSLLAGGATCLLAALWARRYGDVEGLLAAMLTGCSFVLITYASEARGYALAGCCAMFALWWLDRRRDIVHWWHYAVFWLSVALGLLSHTTFIFFYAGTLAWSVAGWLQQRRPQSSGKSQYLSADLARWHAVPVLLVGVFYVLHARGLLVGGGPQFTLSEIVEHSLALVAGGAATEPATGLLAMFAAVLTAVGVVISWRRNPSLGALFLIAIVVAPAVTLLVRQPTVLYPRYFYLPFLMTLLAISLTLGWLWRHGMPGKLATSAILAVLLAGNAWSAAELLQIGRGQYLAALEYLVEHTPEEVITVQSDHDFESRFMLTFYVPYLPAGRSWQYVSQDERSAPAPRWAIVNSQADPFVPHPSIRDGRGEPYRLVRVFPKAGLSGYHWAIYEHESPHGAR